MMLNHSAPKGKKMKNTIISVAVTLAMILIALYFLLPIYWVFVSSTKTNNELFNSNMFIPLNSLSENLEWLATHENGVFWRWILNSFIYAFVTSGLSTLISSMGGYALTKFSFRLKRPIHSATLAALMIPQAATIIPIFMMIRSLGLINTYSGVILPMLVSPFGVYFMMVFIQGSLSSEILDAGRIDGANEFRIFFQIVLAIISPGIITLLLISFISTWNNFFLPLILLNQTDLYPVTVGLNIMVSNLRSSPRFNGPLYPLIISGAAISILPALLLFTFLRKYITSGIALGSLKM